MSETVKIWLGDLLDDDIEETKGTIDNEKLFMKGSTTEEEIEGHKNNIAELEEYIEVLQQIKEEYNVNPEEFNI